MSAPGEVTPYEALGGSEAVRALVERFYDIMCEREPELAQLHPCDPPGIVARTPRDNFALFLIGWLGGPEDYVKQFGHPRLRMRHNRVAVNIAMRDAWLRCMARATSERQEQGQLAPAMRAWLDQRFAEVADFMRNVEG
ncbi:MAG: cyanoglobin [Kofleriaceae bacterium]